LYSLCLAHINHLKKNVVVFICLILPSFLLGNIENTRAVYDCFLFFNEVELLKIRLHELADVVDFFVVVESKKTFSNRSKPANFLLHEKEFLKFRDKIIYILLEDSISPTDFWQNEFYQRNQVLTGLINAKNEDIVICSDLDEIPRHTIVKELIDRYEGRSGLLPKKNEVFYLTLDYFVYKLNNKMEHPWTSSVITTVDIIRRKTPQGLRTGSNTINTCIPDAGWHFSWLGKAEDLLYKLKSFSHAKDPFVKDDETMLSIFKHAEDLSFAGIETRARYVPIDSSFPQYVIDNMNDLIEKGFIETNIHG
jgi:beta-1,4-mannosyl-glycoprotein beta-1,4-N-acetylglucosaminyltransferase